MTMIHSNFSPHISPESIYILRTGVPVKLRIIEQVPTPMQQWGIYALVAAAVSIVLVVIVRHYRQLTGRVATLEIVQRDRDALQNCLQLIETALKGLKPSEAPGDEIILGASQPSSKYEEFQALLASIRQRMEQLEAENHSLRNRPSPPPSSPSLAVVPVISEDELQRLRQTLVQDNARIAALEGLNRQLEAQNKVLQDSISARAQPAAPPAQDPKTLDDATRAQQASRADSLSADLTSSVLPSQLPQAATAIIEPIAYPIPAAAASSLPSSSPPTDNASWSAYFYKMYDRLVGRNGETPAKLNKYLYALEELRRNYGDEFYKDIGDIQRIPENEYTPPLVSACKELIKILTNPDINPRLQYQQFVMALRAAADADHPDANPVCTKFIGRLCHCRFTGIQIFSYLSELVLGAVGDLLEGDLTFDEFFTRFNACNTAATKNLPDDQRNSKAVSLFQKLQGHLNWVDFLKDRNVPYVDGIFRLGGRTITVLRHGVPVTHYEKTAMMTRGVLRFWDWLQSNAQAKALPTDPTEFFSKKEKPQITSDFIRFIRNAARKGQRILHVCLEDATIKLHGDESARVQERLDLGHVHENFYALALRMDGEFFNNPTNCKSMGELAARFKEQLLGKPGENKSDEERLKETGFCIPRKLIQESGLAEKFDTLMQEIIQLYFPGSVIPDAIGTHQAFLMLSYAHIALFLSQRLGVSFFEALCKDDIDRGRIFKTIFWLHFLHLTNQINSENLKTVLKLTVAAPLTVKKQGVISSRVLHLERTHPWMALAVKRPSAKTLGGQPINAGEFIVERRAHQTIR